MLQKQLKEIQTSVEQVQVGMDHHLLGGMRHCQEFTLSKVSQWKHWLSDPHRGGYRLKLSVQKEKPSGFLFRAMTLSNMMVGLALCKGDYDHHLGVACHVPCRCGSSGSVEGRKTLSAKIRIAISSQSKRTGLRRNSPSIYILFLEGFCTLMERGVSA